MDYIETEMLTSLATIVLVILCIGVFIAYGAHLTFYALVALALVVGFANAWMIARGGKEARRTAKPATKRKRRRKR